MYTWPGDILMVASIHASTSLKMKWFSTIEFSPIFPNIFSCFTNDEKKNYISHGQLNIQLKLCEGMHCFCHVDGERRKKYPEHSIVFALTFDVTRPWTHLFILRLFFNRVCVSIEICLLSPKNRWRLKIVGAWNPAVCIQHLILDICIFCGKMQSDHESWFTAHFMN